MNGNTVTRKAEIEKIVKVRPFASYYYHHHRCHYDHHHHHLYHHHHHYITTGLIGMQHVSQYTRPSLDHILAQQNDRERMDRNRSIPQEGNSHIPFAVSLFNNQGG
jgi:hypothetical protein